MPIYLPDDFHFTPRIGRWLALLTLAASVGCAKAPANIEQAPSRIEVSAELGDKTRIARRTPAPAAAPATNAATTAATTGDSPPDTPRDWPSFENVVQPTVKEEIVDVLRNAGFYSAFDRLITVVRPQARVAIAPTYATFEVGGRDELGEVIADEMAARGFVVLPRRITSALFQDFGFLPRHAYDVAALAEFGRQIGADAVMGVMVTNADTEIDGPQFGSANYVRAMTVNPLTGEIFPTARLELVLSVGSLPDPVAVEPAPAISDLAADTIAASELPVITLHTAVLARADFVSMPFMLGAGATVPAGTLIKLWVTASPRARIWAFLIGEDGRRLALYPLPVAGNAPAAAGPIIDGDLVEIPMMAWVPVETPGAWTLVVEAVSDAYLANGHWRAKTGVLGESTDRRIIGGPSAALDAMLTALEDASDARDTARQAARARDLVAQWKAAEAARQADLVVWANARLLRASANLPPVTIRDARGAVRDLPALSRLQIGPAGLVAVVPGESVPVKVAELPARVPIHQPFGAGLLQLPEDATATERPHLPVTFVPRAGVGGATLVLPLTVTAPGE